MMKRSLFVFWSAVCHQSGFSVQADEGLQVEVVVRLQCADLSWTWVYIRANRDPDNQQISCSNFIVRYEAVEQTRAAALSVTSLGFLLVQQKQRSCRRKSDVMPSGRHRRQIPLI